MPGLRRHQPRILLLATSITTGCGCGTKLPHNVTSLLGVMDGAASDLRTGLPWQMVEIHEPVRLLFIIETTPETMLGIMERNAGDRPAVPQRLGAAGDARSRFVGDCMSSRTASSSRISPRPTNCPQRAVVASTGIAAGATTWVSPRSDLDARWRQYAVSDRRDIRPNASTTLLQLASRCRVVACAARR